MEENNKIIGSPSDHLANERTFLAWVRTSVALMGFGFVVVKFSLFVKQLSLAVTGHAVVASKGFSTITGVIMVITGAATALIGYLRYRQIRRQLSEGIYSTSSNLLFFLTVLIMTGAIFLVYYLIDNL